MVPDGRNIAASLPSSAATRSHSAQTVGSEPACSSPTSAAAIAARIPGVGRVWVSEARSTRTGATGMKRGGAKRIVWVLGTMRAPGCPGRAGLDSAFPARVQCGP